MKTEILKEKKEISEVLHKKGRLIAGPCSIESEEQLLKTALGLSAAGNVDLLRAGAWKPRTNPGGFEGLGIKSLPWLLKAKQITGLPTAVEVATSKHVEDALSFEVDVLWIGARTTVNPFSVQNIADALRGSDVPVLIKNPVNADLKLWIGAIERLQKSGIKNIGLIHRGFSLYGETKYRNAPLWQIPIEIKRLFPTLPLICDPSHICGNTENLQTVVQKSIDLNYDGLMIESHYDPSNALTDKAQQLTPTQLQGLIENLVYKKQDSSEINFVQSLEALRERINAIDDELINKLSERMNVAVKIGQLKKQSKVTVLQPGRYNEIIEKTVSKGALYGLSETFIKAYMESVHIESIRLQNNVKE
ncbi:MAG: chorismate mutase [Bacteroidia bacterium]